MYKTIHTFRLFIREEKRRAPVQRKILEKLADHAFFITGRKEGDISLVFCDDEFIRGLNERYLHRSGPTDVLSFSMREGEYSELGDALLGDIVISVDTARKQAEQMNHSLEKEIMVLFIHGLLHLLGYIHNLENERREMTEHTKTILREVDSGI